MFGWTPGIGDPTVYGWTAVVAYAVAAGLSWWASQCRPPTERWFWLPVAVMLTFLMINKQLDLQDLLRLAGRAEATSHGWYDHRRPFQVAFVGVLAAAGAMYASLLWRRIQHADGLLKGAAVGVTVLLLYVVIRATTLQKVDLVIDRPAFAGSAYATDTMELGSILIIAGFALVACRRARRSRRG